MTNFLKKKHKHKVRTRKVLNFFFKKIKPFFNPQ